MTMFKPSVTAVCVGLPSSDSFSLNRFEILAAASGKFKDIKSMRIENIQPAHPKKTAVVLKNA